MGDAPRLSVALAGLERGRAPGSWRAAWRIGNEGTATVTITRAWHPHGRFRSRRRALALRIPPQRWASLELTARCDAPAGSAVENVFLILDLTAARRRWRALARLALRVGTDGAPSFVVEAVDVHPAAG